MTHICIILAIHSLFYFVHVISAVVQTVSVMFPQPAQLLKEADTDIMETANVAQLLLVKGKCIKKKKSEILFQYTYKKRQMFL